MWDIVLDILFILSYLLVCVIGGVLGSLLAVFLYYSWEKSSISYGWDAVRGTVSDILGYRARRRASQDVDWEAMKLYCKADVEATTKMFSRKPQEIQMYEGIYVFPEEENRAVPGSDESK